MTSLVLVEARCHALILQEKGRREVSGEVREANEKVHEGQKARGFL